MIEVGTRFKNRSTGYADTYEVTAISGSIASMYNVTKEEPCGDILLSALDSIVEEGHWSIV